MYTRLLDESLRIISTDHPVNWDSEESSIECNKQILVADFTHVHRLFDEDAARIEQIFSVIMPLISICDGKASIAQNRSIGFLTAFATILLPLNAVAAILAILSPYGLKGEGFWIFWAASAIVRFVVLGSFLVYGFVLNKSVKNSSAKDEKMGTCAWQV